MIQPSDYGGWDGSFCLTDFEGAVIRPLLLTGAGGVPRVDDRRVERDFLAAADGRASADIPER